MLSLALHEGIVTSSVFLKCQYKLDDNKQIKNSGKGKHSWLSGLTKCGYCKYTMTVVNTQSAAYGTYKYLMCRGKTNYKCCDGHTKVIYVEAVEKIVQNEIFDKVKSINDTPVELEQVENAQANRLKIRIFEIDTQIENLINSLAKSNTVLTDYINRKIADIDSEKKELINKLKEYNERVQPNKNMDSINKCIYNWDESTLEQKKTVAKFLIEKIFIKDNEVAINWKI